MIVLPAPSALHCPDGRAIECNRPVQTVVIKVADTPGPDGLIPVAPPSNGESVPPDEAAVTKIIIEKLSQQVSDQAKTAPPARRDQHPKTHGCVKASFQVLEGPPPYLRVGLFASAHTYNAWIRFSNGSPTIQADSVGDVRGMAIKVMGVDGSPSTTQDFVMINGPAFFMQTGADYISLLDAKPEWRFFVPSWNPFDIRVRDVLNVRAMTSQAVTDPLQIRYWSTLPFLFGNTAFKYSARPVGPEPAMEATPSPDFLRENMARHVSDEGASFDVLIQVQSDPAKQPIEDPRIEWSENDSPFITVARVKIPPQTFDTPDQQTFCETLSFTPWHGLPAFRPLGGINRVRRSVYETISTLRHALNNAPRQEPKGF